MGCSTCGGARPGFTRLYFYLVAGQEPRSTTDQAEAIQWQNEAGGAGRIERRVVKDDATV